MFSVQTSVTIARSPQTVFEFVSDQTNAPKWQSGLHEVRRLTPGPIRVGTEHAFVRRFAGRRLESRNRFVRFEPGHFVEFEIPEGWLAGRASYRVQPHGDGTLLTSTVELTAKGLLSPFEGLLQRILRHDSRRDEARLVELLETAATRTPAGG